MASIVEAGPEQKEAVRLLRDRYPQYVAMAIDGAPVIRIQVRSYFAWSAGGG
jgi:hypothetical protein